MKKILFVTVLATSAFLSFSQPKIQFDKTTHDFGNVPQEGGSVTGRFEFSNVGDSALTLVNVKASCGCTTPSYTKEAIPPGGRGFIDATYRPSGAAPFTKNITVTTNESENNKTTLYIKGTVVTRPPTVFEAAGYIEGEGMTRIKNAKVFVEMKNTEIHTDTFRIKNFWDKNVQVQVIDLPKSGYLKEAYRSFGSELKANEEGFLVFLYDAPKRNLFGDVLDVVTIQTNDSIEPVKSIFYNVTIREDFSKLNQKKLEKSPKISVDVTSVDFEKVKVGESSTKSITITNTGKSKLIIHRIQSTVSNIIPVTANTVIEAGKSMNLEIKCNADKIGRNKGQLKITSNDPAQDILLINVEAEVVK
jgi:hypothetical protein